MPSINPYTIKNKEELAKKYPDFARRVGGNAKSKKEGSELEKILKMILSRQSRRFKRGRAKQPYKKRPLLKDPMGNQNLPPEEPASFGYAGGILGGTGAPPGAPSSIYSDIASMGRPPMGIPLTADPYGWNPSDMEGIVADQAARDAQALYPQELGPDYMPMNTAPPLLQSWNDPTPQPGEGTYMGGDWPVRQDPMAEMKRQLIPNAILEQAINKIWEKGSY